LIKAKPGAATAPGFTRIFTRVCYPRRAADENPNVVADG